MPTRPIGSAVGGRVACLRTPSAKSAYGRSSRSATARERASISRSSSGVDDEVEPGRGGEQLDGAVVVRRPEAARDDAEVGLQPLAERGCELAGVSPTIEIRAGSRPSERSSRARNGPFRSVRSPRTSSLPVTTIAARGPLGARACVSAGEAGRAVRRHGRASAETRCPRPGRHAPAVQVHAHVRGR